MSKAILVMDMPNRCKGCDFLLTSNDKDFCRIVLREIDDCDFYVKRSDWCPLKPIPDKKDRNKVVGDYLRGRCDGYNACIDEIMKGSEENEIN